ncbi:hypothetical protein D3C71_2118070 [compost metagenome]
MHVNHTHRIENDRLFERLEIYAPGPQAKPVYSLDRDTPLSIISDLDGALQSLKYGEFIARSLADKHGADSVSFASTVPGAALIFAGDE